MVHWWWPWLVAIRRRRPGPSPDGCWPSRRPRHCRSTRRTSIPGNSKAVRSSPPMGARWAWWRGSSSRRRTICGWCARDRGSIWFPRWRRSFRTWIWRAAGWSSTPRKACSNCKRPSRRTSAGAMGAPFEASMRNDSIRIDIVPLFPAMVEGPLAESIVGRARRRGLVDIRVVNLRDHAADRHRTTDDYQFGGGGGMVLKPEPLFAAVTALRTPAARVILMDPRGRLFTQSVAKDLAGREHLILLAGRYEGVDERVRNLLADEALSIGDYVLTGGELPALVVTDAVVRLLPGVLGAEGAAERESFASGLLEPPQYTRPVEYAGARVPEVLLSGDHARIARWRRVQALWCTWQARRDLLASAPLTAEERALIERFEHGDTPDDVR